MALLSNGQPQKLPYRHKEKIVDKVATIKTVTGKMLNLAGLNSNVPEIKDFKSQAKREIKTRTNKSACLLKSKTLAVQGRKKIGIKKTAASMAPLLILSSKETFGLGSSCSIIFILTI